MQVDALVNLLRQQEEMGLGSVVLKVPKKKSPRGNRCALLPGLNGVCCAYDGTHAVVMVETNGLRRWLEKRGVHVAR